MTDYLAKPIEEEKLHNLLLRYKLVLVQPSGLLPQSLLSRWSTRTRRSTGNWRCGKPPEK